MCRRIISEVDAKILPEIVSYDPSSGRLFWKERRLEHFAHVTESHRERVCKRFNDKWAGKEALTQISGDGYRVGSIFAKNVQAHRVIMALQTGEWPPHDVDHINGDRLDNRRCNLRLATRLQNSRNARRRSDNTSGHVGVYRIRNGKWASEIMDQGKKIHLGSFADIGAAISARANAEMRLGFHPNHGRE